MEDRGSPRQGKVKKEDKWRKCRPREKAMKKYKKDRSQACWCYVRMFQTTLWNSRQFYTIKLTPSEVIYIAKRIYLTKLSQGLKLGTVKFCNDVINYTRGCDKLTRIHSYWLYKQANGTQQRILFNVYLDPSSKEEEVRRNCTAS